MDTYDVQHTANGGDGAFAPMPEGPQVIVCVDGIYLGKKVDQYQDQPAKLVEKYVLVFQSAELNPETGKPYEVSKEFTISMNERAALRKFLTAWRGRAYSEEEAKNVPLHKVDGQCGIGTIEHKVSAKGRTYAVLSNITPLMRGMTAIPPRDYERGSYWQTRKDEYAAGVAAFNSRTPAAPAAPAPRPAPAPPLAQPAYAMAGAPSLTNNLPAALQDTGDDLPFDRAAHTSNAREAKPGRVGGVDVLAIQSQAEIEAEYARAEWPSATGALALNDTRRAPARRSPYTEGR